MKFAHSVSALILTFGMATSAMATTSTADLIKNCDQESTRESVLTELEKESGISFDLQSVAGGEELSAMVEEARAQKFTKTSEEALKHIRTVLRIAREGVEQGKAASLKESAYQDKQVITIIGNFYSTMMDIFTPVLDFTEHGLQSQAKGQSITEIEVQGLMSDLDAKSAIYNASLASLAKFQAKMEKMDDEKKILLSLQMDNLTSNITTQTCVAAVKEIRK